MKRLTVIHLQEIRQTSVFQSKKEKDYYIPLKDIVLAQLIK